jgi:hypothetical protein
MTDLFQLILGVLASLFRSRAKLEAEILVLRQHVNVLRRRASKRPHFNNTDRFLFVWLYRWFPSVLGAITIVRPETIVQWGARKRGVPLPCVTSAYTTSSHALQRSVTSLLDGNTEAAFSAELVTAVSTEIGMGFVPISIYWHAMNSDLIPGVALRAVPLKVREISSGSWLTAALHHSKQPNWPIAKLHAVRESCE